MTDPKAEQRGQGWVTPDQARDSVLRFVSSHFRHKRLGEQARFSIPVDMNRDDDMLLMQFIDQVEATLQDHDRLVQALEKARFAFAFLKDDDQGMDSHVLDDVEAEVCAALDTIQKKV